MKEPPNFGLTTLEIAAVVRAIRRGADRDMTEDELVDQVEEFDNRIMKARFALTLLGLVRAGRLALWWDDDLGDFRMRVL